MPLLISQRIMNSGSLKADHNRRCRSPSPAVVSYSVNNMEQLHPNPKPLRRCRSASPAPPRGPVISLERQNLIKRSWQRVPKTQFGESMMGNLINRIGKQSFGEDKESQVIHRHQRHFLELIQAAVDNMQDLESALKPWLDLLGKGHAGFQIKARHWDAFGESLMSCITEWIGPGRVHRETIKAWMVLTSFLSDRLSAASRVTQHSPMMTPRLQLMTYVQPY